MSEDIYKSPDAQKQSVTPREQFMRYVRFLPLILISMALLFSLAYLKIRYETPIFEVKSKLLVAKPTGISNGNEKFDDIFGIQNNSKINDEIEIIKSRMMAIRVVKSLGLQKDIINKGKIRSTHIKNAESPFEFQILHQEDSSKGFTFEIQMQKDHFTLSDGTEKYPYGQVVHQNEVDFRIIKNNIDLTRFASNIFQLSWLPLEKAASGLGGGIVVGLATEGTNVLALSYRTDNVSLGIDIVNGYMSEYQKYNLEDKRLTAESALSFIDAQLADVRKELGEVEQNLLDYREKNSVINAEKQGELAFSEMAETKKMLMEQRIKLRINDFLINYLSDQKNTYKKVSLTLGIEEPALLQLITEFNKLQIERETALKSIPVGHPTIRNLEVALERLRADLVETLQNIRRTQQIVLDDLSRQSNEANTIVSAIPSKEKRGLEVVRQQEILKELFQYLLQKKLETSIASASTISNIKVMESAMQAGGMVSPNKGSIYLIAFIIGLGLPLGVVFLIDYLNDKVRNRVDIQNMTDTPILGEVGHSVEGATGALVVNSNARSVVAEQFRIIRSNLNYMIPDVQKPVIMLTSTFSGEGKSFISTNIGGVMALSGKRTVILEFDIRKPKIMKGLQITEKFKGISNYVIGKASMEEIVYPLPGRENMFVIPCGPIPPNPSELLLSPKIAEMFAWLKEHYDVVIIDTAPVGLVSDAFTLGKYADCVGYVVRHNYTNKKQLLLLDDYYHSKKLPRLSVVINDIQNTGGYGNYYSYGGYGGYGYGYGYGGYGYGYGYGYGSDYFDQEKPKKSKSIFSRAKRRFKKILRLK